MCKRFRRAKLSIFDQKKEDAEIKNLNDPSAFIEYSNSMDGIFDEMISHVIKDKKAQHVLQDLFTRPRKLNISLVFISQSYFSVTKTMRLNCTHHLIFKVYNRKELQEIAIDHSADIDYKIFLKIYRNCTKEPYSFLIINTTLSSSDPLKFRKNFSDSPL